MRRTKARLLLVALTVLLTSIFEIGVHVPQAHAIIGRPLTPMSVAGVARRTTRRSVAVGAVAGPGAYYW